jgi:ribose 5-phosphate isomerase
MMIVKRIDITPTKEFSQETGGAGKVSFVTDTGDVIFDCQIKPGRDALKRNPVVAYIS